MNKLISTVYMHYRVLTSSFRALPNYLIVGAQKSGSTSLYEYLIQHPEVSAAKKKEVHFFSNNFEKGFNWYRAHFDLSFSSGLVGEATPYYLYHPLAAERIRKTLPDVKIIIVLREPSVRAISHYHHAVRQGFESESMAKAFTRDLTRYKTLRKSVQSGERVLEHQENSYISRGFYSDQLDKYYALFDPRNILLLNSEDLFNNTEMTLKKVFAFLGVDSNFKPFDISTKNAGRYKTSSYEETSPIFDWLYNIYKTHNDELKSKYGVKFFD